MLEGSWRWPADLFEPELMAARRASTRRRRSRRSTSLAPRSRPSHRCAAPLSLRHPLVRRAVYEASPGGWRLGAHQRSAEALAARGAAAAARAHHLERSARRATTRPSQFSGGRRRGRAAHAGRRGTLFAAALRLLGDSAPAEERVELLTALAGTEAATGHFAERAPRCCRRSSCCRTIPARGSLDGGVRRSRAAARRHEEAHPAS
jgi:hypothetical protein